MLIRRGFVEWDVVEINDDVEKALFEVGVRAVLLRREHATSLVAPFVRGVDVCVAEAKNREKFNVYVYRPEVQIIRVNPRAPITRSQARTALKMAKYVELPLAPLLSDIHLLAHWLEVLEPEATVISLGISRAEEVKAPLDVAALLVEISGDEGWALPIRNSLAVLTELLARHG